jgi:antitoxin MazE
MTVRVQKWGNSLGVRIPKAVADQSQIREGCELEVSFEDGRVVLNPNKVPSLKQLLAGIRPGDRPDLVDWGKAVGKEVW